MAWLPAFETGSSTHATISRVVFSTGFAGGKAVVDFLLYVTIPLSLHSLRLSSLPIEVIVAPSVVVVVVVEVVVAAVVVDVAVIVIPQSIGILPIVYFFLCPFFVSCLEKLSSALSDFVVPVLSPDGT